MVEEIVLPDFSLNRAFEETKNELRIGARNKAHPFRLFTLATANSEDINQRSVILREVDENFHFFIFTDVRSNKVKDFRKGSTRCSCLFYNERQKFQVSVKASMHLHYDDSLCEEKFKSVQDYSYSDYNLSMPPGTVIEEPDVSKNLRQQDAYEYFSVLRIVPLEIDILQLRREGHIRALFHREEEEWMMNWMLT